MSGQCNAFLCLWPYRRGPLKVFQTDKEYDNDEFCKLREDWDSELDIVAAKQQEANGGIERANQTLQRTFI